jgi:hypothetical protein
MAEMLRPGDFQAPAGGGIADAIRRFVSGLTSGAAGANPSVYPAGSFRSVPTPDQARAAAEDAARKLQPRTYGPSLEQLGATPPSAAPSDTRGPYGPTLDQLGAAPRQGAGSFIRYQLPGGEWKEYRGAGQAVALEGYDPQSGAYRAARPTDVGTVAEQRAGGAPGESVVQGFGRELRGSLKGGMVTQKDFRPEDVFLGQRMAQEAQDPLDVYARQRDIDVRSTGDIERQKLEARRENLGIAAQRRDAQLADVRQRYAMAVQAAKSQFKGKELEARLDALDMQRQNDESRIQYDFSIAGDAPSGAYRYQPGGPGGVP